MRRNVFTRRRFVRASIRLAVASPLVLWKPLDTLAQMPSVGAAERRTLRAAADAIIPAQGPMPAASAVGAVRYVERIARTDPVLAALLLDGLRAVESQATTTQSTRFHLIGMDQQAEILARLEKGDTPVGFFAALRDLVYEAYYTQPRIQKLLGYDFRSGRRRTAPLQPFDEQRVSRLRQMTPLYRKVAS
jgi:hypothetical protein